METSKNFYPRTAAFLLVLTCQCGGYDQPAGQAVTGGGSGPGSGGASANGGSAQGPNAGSSGNGTGTTGGDGSVGGGTTGGGATGGGAGGTMMMVPDPPPKADPAIDGPFAAAYEYKVHHPFRLTLDGPASSDAGDPNPFLDFRLIVTFKTPSGKTYAVPGYFAGDGKMGSTGNKWRVHFNPPEVGEYSYSVSFRAAAGIAIVTDAAMGAPQAPDATVGTFSIANTDKKAPDFRATGKLTYTKQHYYQTIGDGKPWIKTGSNSPENLLGYEDFSNTTDGPAGLAKNFLHKYGPHVADWHDGDPTWNNGKGKGLIGAINYLASVGVNSMGFMFENLNGDGDDTIPWLSRTERTRFDNVKLQEWEVAFSHAETKGVAIQDFTCEAENFNLLGLTTNGKVYYHEMVARFAHHGGFTWNIGEENSFSNADRKGIAAYLMSLDPYRNPVANHTQAGQSNSENPPLMGDPNIVASSIQDNPSAFAGQSVSLRDQSDKAKVPWVVMTDEQNPANVGASDCPTPGKGNADALRKTAVWQFLLAGGGGFEWYMGYGNTCTDVNCEDYRSHTMIYKYSAYARQLLQELPLNEMQPDNSLASGGGSVLFKKGVVYVVYLPNGGSATLNLAGETGPFRLRFYNVTDGTYGADGMIMGGGTANLGAPPFPGDVAALVQKM